MKKTAKMECLHTSIIDRYCNDCGLQVVGLEMASVWNGQNVSHRRVEGEQGKLDVLLRSVGVGVATINGVHKVLGKVADANGSLLKGRRKLGVAFAHVFVVGEPQDPDELRRLLGMTRKECSRGLALYEQVMGPVSWTWINLLNVKLKTLGLVQIHAEVQACIMATIGRGRLARQMAAFTILTCSNMSIPIDLERVASTFGCKLKSLKKYRGIKSCINIIQKGNKLKTL